MHGLGPPWGVFVRRLRKYSVGPSKIPRSQSARAKQTPLCLLFRSKIQVEHIGAMCQRCLRRCRFLSPSARTSCNGDRYESQLIQARSGSGQLGLNTGMRTTWRTPTTREISQTTVKTLATIYSQRLKLALYFSLVSRRFIGTVGNIKQGENRSELGSI